MQIISFPAHFQSVYTNFYISSFSLISGSASLYQRQADNSNIALTDIFETFNYFRACRDKKMRSM